MPPKVKGKFRGIRKFGGKAFGFHKSSSSKSSAKEVAERLRSVGALARVVKSKGRWVVYARAGR